MAAEKKSNPVKVPGPDESKGKWMPICNLVVDDYDEDLGAFTGAQHKARMEQNSLSMRVRTVRVDG